MRGASRRATSALAIGVRAFAWDAEQIATIRHSTLPWFESFAAEMEIGAKPLADAKQLGARDRLSLVAQFAAHQALLQFAGIADGELVVDEWAIAPRRGSDPRLVRIAARACTAIDAPPLLTTIEQFAAAIDAAALDTFRQSWARAETVYAEVLAAITNNIAAGTAWMRSAARGEILPPGAEGLREFVAGTSCATECDVHAADALRAMSVLQPDFEVIAIGGGSILERYASLADLRRLVPDLRELNENEIVERLVPLAAEKRIVAIVGDAPLDPASARVVPLLSTIERMTVLRATERPAERKWFVVSTRLAAREALHQRIAACRDADAWLRGFIESREFVDYLKNGDVPPSDAPGIDLPEPRRSYIAALALLGSKVPGPVARRYLAQFLFTGELDELAVNGFCEVENDEYRFVSDDARKRVIALIPASSHAALYRIAARAAQESGRPHDAARLLLEAGDAPAAASIFDGLEWSSPEILVRELSTVPPDAMQSSPGLAERFAHALIDCGRYRDAREAAARLDGAAREWALARVERQTGDYDGALERIRLLPESCAANVLRAEILSVHRRSVEARELLRSCRPVNDDDRVRAGYQLALLDERADLSWQTSRSLLRDYYVARLETYRARDAAIALDAVERALASATTVIQRLDAMLDRMYVLFSAGRWAEARAAALEGLRESEETQGDRSAGGFLFVISYLAADDGQWAHASQRIERLRKFYSGTRDARRLDELALLSAHLEFSRGRFDDAAREAETLVDVRHDAQIREAAALIVDESNWILGREAPLRSSGSTDNVELTDRHRLLCSRRGDIGQAFASAFLAAIAAWEHDGSMPHAASGTEKLMLLRSALGRRDHVAAELLAREVGIDLAPRATPEPRHIEQAVLRVIAGCEFPFDERPIAGVAWRYATRNRLRQWQQIGSLPPLAQERIEEITERVANDWCVLSDRELVFLDGISRWTEETRDAVVALFRTKAELFRLRRVLEQEDGDRSFAETRSSAGIIGESAAIRDLLALVALVARRDVPICILGESGTGKELVARAIHAQSGRRSRPFTAINCAALPENLIESELFGHARGAFTGADRDRAGVIESTDGGTLFLDEIGEMPLTAQAKLLRFLQDGEFRRVGDTSNRFADVRIVAATNRKLESAVEEGRFREDLYYRIRGLEAVLPPLRQRGRDILLLSSHFIAAEREKHRAGPSRLSAEAETIFLAYNWPGNVRELQNTIRAAHAIAGDAREIDVDHLPERLRRIVAPRTTVSSYQDAVTRFRRDLIEKSLAEAMGNQNRAASLLNISRQALAYQIRELGIMVEKPKKKPLAVDRNLSS